MMVDVPPLLMSGSGCPVTGAKPTATAMLKSAWVTSMMASPMQRKAGKLFSHLLAILPGSEQEDDVEECNQCGSPYTHLFDDDGIDEV